MHRSETYDLVHCSLCGAEVSRSRDRTFAFGDNDALCFACAVGRGGRYDEDADRWVAWPDLSGVDESR